MKYVKMKKVQIAVLLTVAVITTIVAGSYLSRIGLPRTRAEAHLVDFTWAPSGGELGNNRDWVVVFTVKPRGLGQQITKMKTILKASGNLKIVRVERPVLLPGDRFIGHLLGRVMKENTFSFTEAQAVLDYETNPEWEGGGIEESPEGMNFEVWVKSDEVGPGALELDMASTKIEGRGDVYTGVYENPGTAKAEFDFQIPGEAGHPVPIEEPSPTDNPTQSPTQTPVNSTGTPFIIAEARDQSGALISGVVMGRADCDANSAPNKSCNFFFRSNKNNPHRIPKGVPTKEYVGAMISLQGTPYVLEGIDGQPAGSKLEDCHSREDRTSCLVYPARFFTQGERKVVFHLRTVMCTPPPCQSGEGYSCPSGNCPGGCGTVCTPSSETLRPTASGPLVCALKSRGDANCDGQINLVDFSFWRKDYLGDTVICQSLDCFYPADFNRDRKVDLLDFAILRANL